MNSYNPVVMISSTIVELKVMYRKNIKKRKYIIFNFQMQHFVCMECVLGHIIIIIVH